MKTIHGIILAALVGGSLFVSAASAQEVDLSGTWVMTMVEKSPTGDESAQLTFTTEGHELVATMSGSKGEVECRGFFDGQAIRFYYIRPTKKEDFVAKFTGHVHGDLMGGEVDMGKRGTTTWLATRGAESGVDLSGTWTLQMKDGKPANLHHQQLTFTQDGAAFIVGLSGAGGEMECDGFVDGRRLRFYCVTTGEGGYVAKFTGQIAGAFIGGDLDLGNKGKTTWRATKNI